MFIGVGRSGYHNIFTWYFCGPTAAIHIPMLTSSPCNIQDRFLTSYLWLSAIISPHSHLLSGTLPGRPSVYLHYWRATVPGHERPRSLSRRRTPGRLDWRTPAPATSQCGPLPSSAWNWVRYIIITSCLLSLDPSSFWQSVPVSFIWSSADSAMKLSCKHKWAKKKSPAGINIVNRITH